MKKFRIVEQNGLFYPQVKGWLRWKALPCPDRRGMTSCEINGIVAVPDKENADTLIHRYVNRSIRTIYQHRTAAQGAASQKNQA
jgi:hypothetical protein